MSLIGPAYTKELFFTARTDFSAQDALRMGLVNQVVPKAESRDQDLAKVRSETGTQAARPFLRSK